MKPPTPAELRQLIDNLRPNTVLKRLGGKLPPELCVYKAEALLELDRHEEAHELLDPIIPELQGDDLSNALRFKAYALARKGELDNSIVTAQHAARVAQSETARADALASAAIDLAVKHCWGLATSTLREAIELAPNRPRVLVAQARLRLEADQRLEARAIYERMATLDLLWARAYANWGLAHVAYLLGEFKQVKTLAQAALKYSDEIIWPFFVLTYVAFTQEDAGALQAAIKEIERRSPKAHSLTVFKQQLELLEKRRKADPAKRRRLYAFPSTVQRRDHCGPCVVELVLRYWQGGLDLTSDEIAANVKLPHSGSPPQQMREFFHLVGFDTVHCFAPADKLRQLINAGYPVIIEEEFPGTCHVAVAIGYDDTSNEIELQDPMTHAIISVPTDLLDQIRRSHYNSALIAFPANRGHAIALARMNLFEEAALTLMDQAALALNQNRLSDVAELAARAIQKQPALQRAWNIWLHAELKQWQIAHHALPVQPDGLGACIKRPHAQEPSARREQFYAVLARAQAAHPDADFVHQYQGAGALTDGDVQGALAAYQRAQAIEADDPRTLAALAECHYHLREVDKALEMAQEALKRAPWLAEANAWAARCLAYQLQKQASCEHYARCALDLAPNWWLAHQTMAEFYFQSSDYDSARREVELALSLHPATPEPRVLRAILIGIGDDPAVAVSELDLILKQARRLTPMTTFQAYQGLCRFLFGQQLFDLAIEQINRLLALMPDDPWALQFLAAAYCERAIQNKDTGNPETIQEAQRLYDRAIAANKGTSWIVRNYLDYLSRMVDAKAVASVAMTVRETYPQNGNLIFLHALALAQAGLAQAAAGAMLQALARPDGVYNPQELYDAVEIILNGLGLAAGEKAILSMPLPQGGAPLADRERALGLALALHPEQTQRARQLLTQARERDPNDAFAALRLGDIAPTEAERESFYRLALRLAPNWAKARATLAHYLLDQQRGQEALELTSGHEHESFELLTAHARSLYRAGRLDEAAACCEQAISQSPLPALYRLKWQAENDNGQDLAALTTAQQAIQLFPTEPQWYCRAAASLIYMGQFDEAEKLVEQNKAGLSAADVLRVHYQLAEAKQDYLAALDIATSLIQQEADALRPQRLGQWESTKLRLLAEMGRIADIRAFLRPKSLDAEGWGQAGWAIVEAGQSALALEFAEQALALNASSFAGLYVRAQALYDLDRADEAWAAFEKLRQTFPYDHSAYEKFALKQALEGNLAEAWNLAERAVEFGPACPYAWATRGVVNLLRAERAQAQADLQTGWNRASLSQRRKPCEFWWVLAALQGDQALAQTRKQRALEQTTTAITRRVIACLETLLLPQDQ